MRSRGTPTIGGFMGEGMNLSNLWPIGLMFVLFYFLLIRPQQKRQAQQKQMLDALREGDEVATASGIMGRVAKINETAVSIEIAPDVKIIIQKASITNLLPNGTLDSLDSDDEMPPSNILPPPPPSCCM